MKQKTFREKYHLKYQKGIRKKNKYFFLEETLSQVHCHFCLEFLFLYSLFLAFYLFGLFLFIYIYIFSILFLYHFLTFQFIFYFIFFCIKNFFIRIYPHITFFFLDISFYCVLHKLNIRKLF